MNTIEDIVQLILPRYRESKRNTNKTAMNQASNASGTTHTTTTLLDDSNSSIGSSSLLSGSNGICDYDNDAASNTTISQHSCYSDNTVERIRQNVGLGADMILNRIWNYRKRTFIEYEHLRTATCEDVCIVFSRDMGILPNTRYIFGLRVFDSEEEWCLPGQTLRPNVAYCFRMRFKVPFAQLQTIDPMAYEYLYNQMRYDMVQECIPEIRYPNKKNNVMGLGAVDMYIDFLEKRDSAVRIDKKCKRYLPRKLIDAHNIFAKKSLRETFHKLTADLSVDLFQLKWQYICSLNELAPDYLMEQYVGLVDFIPDEIGGGGGDGGISNPPTSSVKVYIKLDLFDSPEPGLKVAKITANEKAKLKWVLVSKFENIYLVYTRATPTLANSSLSCRLEITGMPNGYRIEFENKIQLESFISYLSGYMRLTTKWTVDLCVQYITPSLRELSELRCHGPVGGAFSFAKIREQSDKCGSYIIRQCEKEYDTYYIDINTKSIHEGLQPEKCKTETFKITKKTCFLSSPSSSSSYSSNIKWILHYNDQIEVFEKLYDLAQSIKTEAEQNSRIPPTEYDKSPQLLICLPKNVQSKKTEKEFSEAELQRKRVQIFDGPKDLQWYHNSACECDHGKMVKIKADWIQHDGYNDVSVTVKVLKKDKDLKEFMNLANTWSRISSPHIIKLFGMTLTTPYTMVLEYSKFGPLNEFLAHNKKKITLSQLLDVVHGLVRGIVYLQEHAIIHGYIRCCNLLVTKFDTKSQLFGAKISDPGFPRSYRTAELPWIPFDYHNNLNDAKKHLDVDLWAFATTVWEIFARGKNIEGRYTSENLRQNYSRYGAILEVPSKDCPEEMYQVMMDGWSMEADKHFNHMHIFQRLIYVKNNLNDDYSSIEIPEFNLDELGGGGALNLSNPNNECVPLSFCATIPSVMEIPNGKVVFKNKIGEGHYGTVHLGEVQYYNHNACQKVAIKTLKSLRASEINDDFKREIEIMESLDHPNIVKIKHWIQRPFCIIMEYLESGSFLVYLTSKKPNLTDQILLGFALDIARGMDYLASKNIIHRDLAARNILVDRDSVKLSDFGLAQRANSEGYYIANSKRDIPIKWYSPEAINENAKFSSQSDVWSYGVTLFEMFSRGESPNLDTRELRQDEFIERLERGDRLRKPTLCPDIVYERLMKPCWHINPKMRPTFREIIDTIQSIRNELNNMHIPK